MAAKGIRLDKGQTLFSLVLRAKDSGILENHIGFENRTFTNEFYDVEGMKSIRFVLSNDSSKHQLGANYPNPFTVSTTLPITLAHASNIQIRVYTLQGQTIWQHSQFLNKGQFQLPITAPFSDNGIYFYELLVGDERFSGKLSYKSNNKM